MLHKLEAANGAPISYDTKPGLIEKTLQKMSRLPIKIFSIFYKANSKKIAKVSDNTHHLQYEIYHLVGEININNAALMKRELLKIVSNHKSILLDFSKLNFIDSSGIAIIIESFNLTDMSGLKLTIVGAKELPLKMLELTQLDKVFNLRTG
jgi:anti-sigma B factor antagonist